MSCPGQLKRNTKEPIHLPQRRAPCIAGRAEGAHPSLHVLFRRCGQDPYFSYLDFWSCTILSLIVFFWKALLDLVLPTPMAPGQRPSLHGELQFKASKWFYSFSFFFLVFDRNTQLGQLGGFVQQEQQVNGNQSCTASQGRLVARRQCTLAA